MSIASETLGYRGMQRKPVLRAVQNGMMFVALAPSLAGCDWAREKLRDANDGLVGARQIESELFSKEELARVSDMATRNQLVGRMVFDSTIKCSEFLYGIGTTNRAIGAFFDITSGTLAALGAAFTPAATVRALAAGAAISTGSKTSLQANIFYEKTSAAIADIIWAEYRKSFNEVKAGMAKGLENYPVFIAVTDTLMLHTTCSLDFALAKLNAAASSRDAVNATLEKLSDSVAKIKTVTDSLPGARIAPASPKP